MDYPKTVKLKNGTEVTLRFPQEGDAPEMRKYINELVAEDVRILKNEPVDLPDEEKYLEKIIGDISKNKSVHLFAYLDNELIGICDIRGGNFRSSHVGILGITVRKDSRGIGLGGIMMDEVIKYAKFVLGLKKATLAVYADNETAINLYRKMGFVEYGKLPGAVYFKGNYVDEYLMYRDL